MATFAISIALLLTGIGLGWMTAALRHRSITGALTAKLAESNARLDGRNSDVAPLERRCEQLGAADVKFAAVAAQLDAERRSSTERITAIQSAEARLRDAFQALGAEALRQNSESFLQLARTSLGEMQQATASDLAERQRAIGEMVTPIKETLECMVLAQSRKFRDLGATTAPELATAEGIDTMIRSLDTPDVIPTAAVDMSTEGSSDLAVLGTALGSVREGALGEPLDATLEPAISTTSHHPSSIPSTEYPPA